MQNLEVAENDMSDHSTKVKKQSLSMKILFRTGVFLLIFFAVIGVFFFFSILFTLVSLSNSVRNIDTNNKKSILAIGNMAGITFPHDILWLNAADIGFQDRHILCKLKANEYDIQLMFADRQIRWSDTDRVVHNHTSLVWFIPDSIKTFKSAEISGSRQNASFVHILYGVSDGDDDANKPLTVYLEIIYL